MSETSTDAPEVSCAPEENTVRLAPQQEMHAPLFWDLYRNKKQLSVDE